MSVECREIVDSIKEPAKCQDCDDLQKEFAKNPGGKPMNRKGLVIAAITGLFAITMPSLQCANPCFFKVVLR